MTRFIAPTLIALLLATTAHAAPDDKVKEIVVELDLTAVTNPAAARRYATIATDLQGAIAARLVDRIDEKGAKILVDLSEVELSNTFTEATGAADTRLVGTVNIYADAAVDMPMAYELTVDVNQAVPFFPVEIDRATLTASSDEFYKAMIAAFAEGVVKRLDE